MSKKIVPAFAIPMTFEDVFGADVDSSKARELLRNYDRGAVLTTLAKVNALLKTWRRRPDFELDMKIAVDFFPDAWLRAREVSKRFPNPFFFTRLGVLATMRVALLECPAIGGQAVDRKGVVCILANCVMMNSLANPSIATSNPTPANILTSGIPLHDSTSRGSFETDIARSLILFEQIAAKRSADKDPTNLGALFLRSVGLDPRTFAEMCISVGARYLTLTMDILNRNPEQFFIDQNYFTNTTVSSSGLQSFLDTVAVTEEQLAQNITARPDRPMSDLTPFQLNPIVRIPDGRFYCLDLACLLDKPGRGMYWTLRGAAPEIMWKRLPGAYGDLFDAYLAKLLPGKMGERTYIPHPEFSDGNELSDGALVEGSDLVMLEFKSSVLRADRKYSGDPKQVLEEIDKKFVTGDESGAKGIAQLVNGIDRLLLGDSVAGIEPSRIRRIYPVMVVLEQTMTAPQVSRYLNDRFERRALGKKHSVTITPLLVVDVENFERLLPYIELYGLGPLLESYYGAHVRTMRDQLAPLKPENIPFLDNRPRLPEMSRARFRDFLKSLGVRMFGIEDAF